MPIKPAKSIWLTAVILGCIYGSLFSLHVWLGLFTNIELTHWHFLSDILFISLLLLLACLGFRFSRQRVPFRMLSLAALLCAVLWDVFFLTTYIVGTTVFVDQAVQIAFFKRDYIYHGYRSVAEALSVNNNTMELIKLQGFSLGISAIIQWGALGIGALISQMTNAKLQNKGG